MPWAIRLSTPTILQVPQRSEDISLWHKIEWLVMHVMMAVDRTVVCMQKQTYTQIVMHGAWLVVALEARCIAEQQLAAHSGLTRLRHCARPNLL